MAKIRIFLNEQESKRIAKYDGDITILSSLGDIEITGQKGDIKTQIPVNQFILMSTTSVEAIDNAYGQFHTIVENWKAAKKYITDNYDGIYKEQEFKAIEYSYIKHSNGLLFFLIPIE